MTFLSPFNPLPSHEGRLPHILIHRSLSHLSIHFPLTREDNFPGRRVPCYWPLSIHFPLTREDNTCTETGMHGKIFQSTSLSRGKTAGEYKKAYIEIFQSTSLSRGKTAGTVESTSRIYLSIHFPLTREDSGPVVRLKRIPLSIHFPLTREDGVEVVGGGLNVSFQSTSLSRGKTFIFN